MVDLRGSEKQIAWAEEIRNKLAIEIKNDITNLDVEITTIDPQRKKFKSYKILLELYKKFENFIYNIDESPFFISKRREEAKDIFLDYIACNHYEVGLEHAGMFSRYFYYSLRYFNYYITDIKEYKEKYNITRKNIL
jgi:hypothetical protein